MEEIPFEFRCTLDTMVLEDYLYIYKTLDEDEYPIVEVNGKKVRNNYPLDKDKRTQPHMKNLHQKVVKYLTNIPVAKLNEDLLVHYCMSKIGEVFSDIESKLEATKSIKYAKPDYSSWSFWRWVLMEQRITKGHNIMEEQEVVSNTAGVNWILAMTYGEFTEDQTILQERYDYFNKELPLKHSLLLYRDQIKEIESIKKRHTFVYGGGGESSGMNMSQHVNIFGWGETLRSLVVTSRAFGDYRQTKSSLLFEVLEFININCSYNKAENADYKAKQKK